jgi:hypothetical protein
MGKGFSFVGPPFVHSALVQHLSELIKFGDDFIAFKLVGLGFLDVLETLGIAFDTMPRIHHRNGDGR